MLIVERTTDDLTNVFASQAVNSTDITIRFDEPSRLESLLFTLCTALSFIMLVFITSFAFLEANRPLLDSRGCIRVISSQSSVGAVEALWRMVISQSDVSAVPQKRRVVPKGYEVWKVSLYMMKIGHWIRRQAVWPWMRLLGVKRVIPKVQAPNGQSLIPTTPPLNVVPNEKRYEPFPARTRPSRSRKGKPRTKKKKMEQASSRRVQLNGRQISAKMMKANKQTAKLLPANIQPSCTGNQGLPVAATASCRWRHEGRTSQTKGLSARRKSRKSRPSPDNDKGDLYTHSDHYRRIHMHHSIVGGVTPVPETICLSLSDDSWRELDELIDKAVNRPSRGEALPCEYYGSQRATTTSLLPSTLSRIGDEDLIHPSPLGFPQIENIPSANVLGTLLSWNNVWSNGENNQSRTDFPLTWIERTERPFYSRITAAATSINQIISDPWSTDRVKEASKAEEVKWTQSVTGQAGRDVPQVPRTNNNSKVLPPIGSLRNRRADDCIGPSIWSPTWQPSSGDPEFSVTYPLMSHRVTEDRRQNERLFPTFLHNTQFRSLPPDDSVAWTDLPASACNTGERSTPEPHSVDVILAWLCRSYLDRC